MLKTLSTSLALCAALFLSAPAHAASHAGAPMAKDKPACEKSADEKKLAGAARSSHIKKCNADAGGGATAKGSPACEKSADDKKLAGAARNSHIKKCNADGMPAKAAAAAPKAAASGAKK